MREKTLIIIKAAPHPSTRYGETVCCAGITDQGAWRRLFPVRFRQLRPDQQFNRWDWVSYEWRHPKDDQRRESRRLQEPTLRLEGKLPPAQRPGFLRPVVVDALAGAVSRGDSLALLQPRSETFRFGYNPKSTSAIERERQVSAEMLSQRSFLDRQLDPLTPCPYEFTAKFEAGGRRHNFKLGDWETEAMFWRFRRELGEMRALSKMMTIFNDDYPRRGMVLALGTQFLYPKTWLLLGLIRLDETNQLSLL